MKKILVYLLLVCLCISGVACNRGDKEVKAEEVVGIDEIYVYHSAFGQRFPEFRIDLRKKEFWEYTTDCCDKYVERDETAKDDGFTFVSNLDEEKIEKFLVDCSEVKFDRWEEEYINKSVCDGHQWGMTIKFSDARKLEIRGSNMYPSTWDNMLTAFKELTGKDILIFSSDWMNN